MDYAHWQIDPKADIVCFFYRFSFMMASLRLQCWKNHFQDERCLASFQLNNLNWWDPSILRLETTLRFNKLNIYVGTALASAFVWENSWDFSNLDFHFCPNCRPPWPVSHNHKTNIHICFNFFLFWANIYWHDPSYQNDFDIGPFALPPI